jgi:hypothetical protein
MLLPRLALVCSLPMLVALAACPSKSTAPATDAKATKATKAGPASDAKPEAPVADPAPGPSADGGPTPTEVAAAETKAAPNASQGPVPSLQDDPAKALGAHLVDPGWYRKTLFGDTAKVLDTKRSKADDQGRFSSLIRFEVPDMTLEGCAEHLQAAVKADVPTIERETKPDGRVHLTGATERYKITFVCGQNEGKTIAFVSYEWT